ncbi:hypothetical protein AMTR_s00076p00135550 [Amborella trichopoda]|uniref:SET domain-containing protein n=1 Tax=Amborella trichopoda TaxID=13333 RepID=W1P492_AMBTC|nr:hypothetical protein AMTR_s00076p00135550 [Amborella trichopoda]
METLKSLVPIRLREMIAQSAPDDLPSTSSSLLDFFLSFPQFHEVLKELNDPETGLCRKNREDALVLKQKGNHCFSNGDYHEALRFYTKALRNTPMSDGEIDKCFVATLYTNRASSLHKLGLLEESIRDCSRALSLLPNHAKAWFRRGKVNVTLKKYEGAINDLNVALKMESSLVGKNQIKDELHFAIKQSKRIGESSTSSCRTNGLELEPDVEPSQAELSCVSTPYKGRGMTSKSDILPGCMIHSEEPIAAIILKHCREAHCHFCFMELPADTIPCSSCTIPLYCSDHCLEKASGKQPERKQINVQDAIEINLSMNAKKEDFAGVSEHGHECGGVHWPAILPVDVVLAGRILVKCLERQKYLGGSFDIITELGLCHNYSSLPSESKVELHIYSVVLAYCLQKSYASLVPFTGPSVSQLIVLVCQIRVNSMAIVCMKSFDASDELRNMGKLTFKKDALTSSVEQVRVGQAIYLRGSLFNHSCEPNIHAYFVSRTLFLRSIEQIPAGSSVELSYGPQIGEWDLAQRQLSLENKYSFMCQCSGCSELNLSDLVLHGFRCAKADCYGAVLNSPVVRHRKLVGNCLQTIVKISRWELALPEGKKKRKAISKVARQLLEETDGLFHIDPGYCLRCGSFHDLESAGVSLKKITAGLERLWDLNGSKDLISNGLRHLELLRSTMHPYSKDIAEAEDKLAEAFCSVGEPHSAMDHCKASIQILEKLYPQNHIAIANELIKLASIQISLIHPMAAKCTVDRVDKILTLHYGSHYSKLFPYVQGFRKEVYQTLQEPIP